MGFTFGGMDGIIPTLSLHKQTPPPTPCQNLLVLCFTTEMKALFRYWQEQQKIIWFVSGEFCLTNLCFVTLQNGINLNFSQIPGTLWSTSVTADKGFS